MTSLRKKKACHRPVLQFLGPIPSTKLIHRDVDYAWKKSLLWNTFDALQVCQCQCFSAAALFNTSVRLSTLYERSWTMARFSHALVINYSVATSWNFCTARPVDPPRHFTWRLRAKFAVAVLRWKGEFWVLRTLRQWLSINWYCDNLFAEQLKDLLRLLQWKVDNILR